MRAGFLFSGALVLVTPEFVRILLGDRWLPMVTAFRLMTIYALLDPLLLTAGNLLTAIGRPQIIVRAQMMQLACFIPAVILMAFQWGIEGVAIAADLMLVVGLAVRWHYARRHVDFSAWQMFRYPTLALLMAGGVAFYFAQSQRLTGDWSALLVKGTIYCLTYSLILLLFERMEYIENAKVIYRLLSRPGGV
jgi:O-antigen/teichoic acid export membrane protein